MQENDPGTNSYPTEVSIYPADQNMIEVHKFLFCKLTNIYN